MHPEGLQSNLDDMALSPINRISTALHTSRVSRTYSIDALTQALASYLPDEQIGQIRAAYEYGEHHHRGQYRKSGEPYIYHPLAVARILADMRMDHTTVIAAILHDVIEDTDAAYAEVAAQFGTPVADLVEGVSKLDKAQFHSRAEAQGENLRKLIMAMTQDIRVILVKLADRLHNMRTIGSRDSKGRQRTARETLEIYAPIARRLGLNAIREELEDLGFSHLYPNRYNVLTRASRKVSGDQKNLVSEIRQTLTDALAEEGIRAEVFGRRKNLYSVYRKMRRKHLRFLDVYDLYGFRIIVEEVDECYRALGIIHHQYQPISELFNDFIANRKVNGYQSLHTTLMARGGIKFEVQIRTREMHQVAETGIAAHWKYKLGEVPGLAAQGAAREWLANLAEMGDTEHDALHFFDNMRVDLSPDAVYVFTPTGEIIRLPRGATCVDFAYAVHTDLGNHCVSARIDGHLAPLNSQLESGQVVEVIVAKRARPNVAWLHFLRTAKARNGVRNYLKNQRDDEATHLGKRMLDRALKDQGTTLRKVKKTDIGSILAELGVVNLQALYTDIGSAKRLAPLVARQLLPDTPDARLNKGKPLVVEGTEGLVLEFAKCCHPLPGDAIHGHVSTGRGLVVHRFGCQTSARQSQGRNRVELTWSTRAQGEFPVELRVLIRNERGVLAKLTAKLADAGCNIESANIPERGGAMTSVKLLVTVRDRRHLANVIRRLRRINAVERVIRS